MSASSWCFITAVLIVAFRYWLTEPRPKNDGGGLITGSIMFVALLAAAAGGLLKVAGL